MGIGVVLTVANTKRGSIRSLQGWLLLWSAPAALAAGAPTADHWAMVDEYCVGCHNTTDWAGKLALDTLDHAQAAIPGDAETWEKVIKRLRGRLMPPPGEKRPANENLDS